VALAHITLKKLREGASILRGYDAGYVSDQRESLRRSAHDTLTHLYLGASPLKGYAYAALAHITARANKVG